MAFGKARSNKRSSGSSYTSTVTTIVFIALCVLGVWMMTSNSVIPPETTTRAATSTTTGDYPSTKTSRQTELSNKDSSAVFEDNPGQLPEDAIKSDDSKNTNVEEKSQEDQNLANSESSSETDIAWGKHTRVILDVGCGVASFGGFLFEKDVITMSFAPKDEHEAQVQFALERGIPAISAVMGSQRLPFPSRVFDLLHCARCRVPWHVEGGALLLELNRVLRPGGYFAWSATPVYQTLEEDVEIWKEMSLMCKTDDDPNAAWYVALQSCMHRVPEEETERGSRWPVDWPSRLQTPPYWLNKSQMGIYGKPAPDDFLTDYQHWKRVVSKTYLSGLGISWANVRNIMDMRAVYGGFAAAMKDLKVWVMNVVNIDSPDTLPIIYERGLFGIYHDWCKIGPVMAEVDRIVRPGGKLIVRDESATIGEVENLLKSMHWEVHLTFSKNQEGILSAQKSDWRPDTYAPAS